jgi:transcriptional regulator with XRE-family HTH domain
MSTNLPGSNILKELGERVARHRLNKNLTQEELARQAGIGSATLKRIEHGSASTQLINFINVLRALGLDQNVELLVPDVPPSPVQLANLPKKNVRQRARSKRKPPQNADTPTWTWSDDHNS